MTPKVDDVVDYRDGDFERYGRVKAILAGGQLVVGVRWNGKREARIISVESITRRWPRLNLHQGAPC